MKILVLETAFWSMKSKRPDEFREKHRKKKNFLEYDYVVMPMHEGG